jgi:hypothetical protein
VACPRGGYFLRRNTGAVIIEIDAVHLVPPGIERPMLGGFAIAANSFDQRPLAIARRVPYPGN